MYNIFLKLIHGRIFQLMIACNHIFYFSFFSKLHYISLVYQTFVSLTISPDLTKNPSKIFFAQETSIFFFWTITTLLYYYKCVIITCLKQNEIENFPSRVRILQFFQYVFSIIFIPFYESSLLSSIYTRSSDKLI